MAFSAESYRDAAREHIEAARALYRSRHFVLCHYVGGLAVECLLRAYRFRKNPEFDARHDLYTLFHDSGILAAIPQPELHAANAALVAVSVRWTNDHRFRSLPELRGFLRRIHLHRGIKGDFVKESARRITEAAAEFIQIGLRAWKQY
jgi:hypothetical protein